MTMKAGLAVRLHSLTESKENREQVRGNRGQKLGAKYGGERKKAKVKARGKWRGL